ncbi:MAG: LCP family protein [Wujia sp.]
MDKEKLQKVLKIIGYIICAAMFVAGGILMFMIARLQILPVNYMLVGALVLVILTVGFVFAQRWFVSGIITKILAVLLTVVMVIGSIYVNFTQKKLEEMTGIKTKVDSIQIYVMVDDPAQNIMDAKDYNFGILSTLDRENTDAVLRESGDEVGQELKTTEYDSALALVRGLYDQEVGAIVLNSAYEGFVTETEGFDDFKSRVKSISFKDIVSQVETSQGADDDLYNGDSVFTVYVSGVDTPGKPEQNHNSDVNILLTVNMDTRQILMISTPRDYYVPLSISGGQKDKLTHAGMYGIDVSADTLGMLYGVKVDDYVKVNFTGFENIIDALDGVNVYSEYSFESYGHYYQQGYNQLNGEEALVFARTRHAFSDGDRQRGRNQMAVIEAVVNDLATSDMLKNYKQVLDEISENIVTSMSYDEISNLVMFQLDDMKPWDIQSYSVNGYDSMATTYSGGAQELYVMEPDMSTVDQAKQYLADMYAGKTIKVAVE